MATPTSSGVIVPTPSLVFETIPQAITCEGLLLQWFYNGPDDLINLVATNVGVSQDAPAPPLTSSSTRSYYPETDKQRRAIPTGAANPAQVLLTVPIASNVDPINPQAFVWSSVDVPQGWYVINATMAADEYSCASANFFVHTGNNTSCITTIGTSSSTTASATPTPTPTSITSSAPSNPVLVVGGTSKLKVGAIAGASIGAIIVIAAAITAWIVLQRKSRGVGTLVSGPSRKWNGLASVDSSRALTSTNPQSYPSTRHQTRNESVGTIPMGGSEEGAGAEKFPIYGKSNEMYSSLDGPGAVLAAMPILQQQSPRSKTISRTYSTSSSSEFLPNELLPPPGRRTSVPDSDIGTRSIDSSNTYPPTSPTSPHGGRGSNQFTTNNMSRSHSSNTSFTQTTTSQSTSSGLVLQQRPATSPQLDPISPTSPTSDAVKQANRNSLGVKRRKPVPAYDPSQDPISLSVPRLFTPPSPAPPSPGPDQMNTTANGAHYATRNQAGQDNSQPDLAHKSSFGPGGVEGQPLHYLIPDMPMNMKG